MWFSLSAPLSRENGGPRLTDVDKVTHLRLLPFRCPAPRAQENDRCLWQPPVAFQLPSTCGWLRWSFCAPSRRRSALSDRPTVSTKHWTRQSNTGTFTAGRAAPTNPTSTTWAATSTNRLDGEAAASFGFPVFHWYRKFDFTPVYISVEIGFYCAECLRRLHIELLFKRRKLERLFCEACIHSSIILMFWVVVWDYFQHFFMILWNR